MLAAAIVYQYSQAKVSLNRTQATLTKLQLQAINVTSQEGTLNKVSMEALHLPSEIPRKQCEGK